MLKWFLKFISEGQPNPYSELHLKVYPNYQKEVEAGTYDPLKDPFCSTEYILAHPFQTFRDIEEELAAELLNFLERRTSAISFR